MFQSALAAGAVSLETALLDFLSEARVDAARAFRVLRDLGRIDLSAELDFIVRAPGQDRLVRLGHPGFWSVSLEPKVTVVDLAGGLLSGERAARAPVEEYLDLFRRRPELTAIARFHAAHLDAWGRGGLDLPFVHTPLVRSDLRQGIRTYERGSAAAALDAALKDNFAGVLHVQGGAVLAGQGVLGLAELMLQVEQAAQVELLSEVWRRSDRLGRRREEERAPSWA